MTKQIELSASLEDYLEAIYHIIKEKQAARVKDIAKRLKVKAASVTGALRSLAKKGLINYAPYEIITFTEPGRVAAEDVVRRHNALKDFFVKVLSVDEKIADNAACQMEHCIKKPMVERLVQFAEFVDNCPRAGSKWIKGFGYYCNNAPKLQNCEKCMRANLNEFKDKLNKVTGDDHMKKDISLSEMKPGEKGQITKIVVSGNAGKRLLEMGFTKGSVIELVKIAPLGDPIDVKIKGYHLTLRKKEAEGVYVEKILS